VLLSFRAVREIPGTCAGAFSRTGRAFLRSYQGFLTAFGMTLDAAVISTSGRNPWAVRRIIISNEEGVSAFVSGLRHCVRKDTRCCCHFEQREKSLGRAPERYLQRGGCFCVRIRASSLRSEGHRVDYLFFLKADASTSYRWTCIPKYSSSRVKRNPPFLSTFWEATFWG